ncbi:MAG TPA: hypothetical protein VK469_21135, partial [Candidatus Kapabacteria bacterium]|nr:hypothetical protein [Candidatus Kapabacteria bacterium]
PYADLRLPGSERPKDKKARNLKVYLEEWCQIIMVAFKTLNEQAAFRISRVINYGLPVWMNTG